MYTPTRIQAACHALNLGTAGFQNGNARRKIRRRRKLMSQSPLLGKLNISRDFFGCPTRYMHKRGAFIRKKVRLWHFCSFEGLEIMEHL